MVAAAHGGSSNSIWWQQHMVAAACSIMGAHHMPRAGWHALACSMVATAHGGSINSIWWQQHMVEAACSIRGAHHCWQQHMWLGGIWWQQQQHMVAAACSILGCAPCLAPTPGPRAPARAGRAGGVQEQRGGGGGGAEGIPGRIRQRQGRVGAAGGDVPGGGRALEGDRALGGECALGDSGGTPSAPSARVAHECCLCRGGAAATARLLPTAGQCRAWRWAGGVLGRRLQAPPTSLMPPPHGRRAVLLVGRQQALHSSTPCPASPPLVLLGATNTSRPASTGASQPCSCSCTGKPSSATRSCSCSCPPTSRTLYGGWGASWCGVWCRRQLLQVLALHVGCGAGGCACWPGLARSKRGKPKAPEVHTGISCGNDCVYWFCTVRLRFCTDRPALNACKARPRPRPQQVLL